MGVNISQEAMTFAATVICGMVCGFLFDILRVVSGVFKNGKVLLINDLIYPLMSVSVIMICFYHFNSYQMRWYMFVGVILGLILYFLLFGRAVVFIFSKILQIIEKILKILLTPVHFLYKILLVYVFVPLYNFNKKIILFLKYKIKCFKIYRGKKFYEKYGKKKYKKTGEKKI